MRKNHLFYLTLGTIFWGLIIGIGVVFFVNEGLDAYWKTILFFILGTVFITLVVQFYIGGFQTTTPKKWFFLPLASWAILLIEQFIIEGSIF